MASKPTLRAIVFYLSRIYEENHLASNENGKKVDAAYVHVAKLFYCCSSVKVIYIGFWKSNINYLFKSGSQKKKIGMRKIHRTMKYMKLILKLF